MTKTTYTSINSNLQEESRKLREQLENFLITAQKSTDELNVNEQRYRLALKGANDGLWDWNLETDTVYFSPRWKSMLGYEEHEIENELETWSRLVHPDQKDRVLEKAQKYLSGEISSFEVEMQMKHKDGHYIHVLSRAFADYLKPEHKPVRLIGTHVDITTRKEAEEFNHKTSDILAMIALGKPASEIYDAIALLYESRHPGMRCSMLELEDGTLLHGGAPSMPKEYCDAVHGLQNGPNVGSCGASTYTGKRCIVENIETHPNWAKIKDAALPHGMRSCWSEPIKSSDGKVLGAFGMYYDYPALPNEKESEDLVSAARIAGIVMERDHDQKRIHELAYTDSLTQLASRAHLQQYLEDLLTSSKKHNRQFSLLFLDLDDFKVINDNLGHDVGDKLLKEISEHLSSTCREIDFIARLGGDEFCIIVEDFDDQYAAGHAAQRCIESVSQPVKLLNQNHTPTCSIGIARFPHDGKDITTLLKSADTALYSAKELGKNRYAFYKPELTKETKKRFYVEKELREALINEQISLVYQPQVDATTGTIIGVEALARWNHPDLGNVPPLEFISIAEQIGVIKPLTEWVLYQACKQANSWQSETGLEVRIAINISPEQFLNKDIIFLVKQAIKETGINANLIKLEVTENVVQTDPKNLSIFQQLKDIGVKLALDDFGTGYSSFASLKHLNIDYLKIDKYFIDDMLSEANSKMLVSSMIDIGHNLGYGVIAEGVETTEQYNLLKDLGCETIQGYLFSKPVNEKIMVDLLMQKSLMSDIQNED